MRTRLLSLALPLVLTAPAFAQQAGDSQQQTPGRQIQQPAAVQPGPPQPRIRQTPQAAGVTDGRSMPNFVLVRAKDTDGNTVLMLVNPETGEAIPLGAANRQPRQPQQQQQALQQQPQHGPQKTIGHARTEVEPSLIVFNARGASLQGGKLVLTGVSPNTILFAEHPAPAAGQDLTAHIIDDWANGSENFTGDPPSATVSGFNKEDASIHDAVVVLKSPTLQGDQLTFDVDVLEGDLTAADGPAAVFIDIADRPPTVGGAHLAARRGAWYAGADGMAAPADGGSATCGHYPYPPCD